MVEVLEDLSLGVFGQQLRVPAQTPTKELLDTTQGCLLPRPRCLKTPHHHMIDPRERTGTTLRRFFAAKTAAHYGLVPVAC